jgi:hypothetical protein
MTTQRLVIRSETKADSGVIGEVTAAAFATLEISGHTEQFIIEALRFAGALALSPRVAVSWGIRSTTRSSDSIAFPNLSTRECHRKSSSHCPSRAIRRGASSISTRDSKPNADTLVERTAKGAGPCAVRRACPAATIIEDRFVSRLSDASWR